MICIKTYGKPLHESRKPPMEPMFERCLLFFLFFPIIALLVIISCYILRMMLQKRTKA